MKEIVKILQNYRFVKKEFYGIIIARMIFVILTISLPVWVKNIYTVIEESGTTGELYFAIGIFACVSILMIVIHLLMNILEVRLRLYLYVRKGLFYRKKNNREELHLYL